MLWIFVRVGIALFYGADGFRDTVHFIVESSDVALVAGNTVEPELGLPVVGIDMSDGIS